MNERLLCDPGNALKIGEGRRIMSENVYAPLLVQMRLMCGAHLVRDQIYHGNRRQDPLLSDACKIYQIGYIYIVKQLLWLYAFRKKTQKTAKKDVDIAKARFRDVIQHRTSQ